jgi:hypothetical protein
VDDGAIQAVPVVLVGHTPVRAHRVVRVELEGGRVLEISPGHPTADGRTFGDLVTGGLLDEQHEVVSANLVPYAHEATYDILPDSSTGTYFAAGALIGSTLVPRVAASGAAQSLNRGPWQSRARSSPRPRTAEATELGAGDGAPRSAIPKVTRTSALHYKTKRFAEIELPRLAARAIARFGATDLVGSTRVGDSARQAAAGNVC